MGKKSKKKEEVFHVEVITQARVARSDSTDEARWEYYVKVMWMLKSDCNSVFASWEPEKNLKAGCGRLLTSFWQHVGMDNDDYQVGYVVKAKQDWIVFLPLGYSSCIILLESEKAFFKAEFDKMLEKERNEKKVQRSKKRKRVKSREATESTSTISQEKAVSKEKSPSPSDSDDDRPLKESSGSLKIKIPKKVILSPEEDVHSPQQSHQQSPQQSLPNSPQQSLTSLFSDPSSPEITLSSRIPPKIRTTSVSAVSAKPKTTRRVTHPQAKIASMSASELATSSGITTKQRIAQGALAPTLPKNLAAIKQAPKPLPNRTPALMNLSFKKHSIPSHAPAQIDASRIEPTTTPGLRSPMVNDPTLASLNSPSAHSPQMLSNSFSSIAKPNAASNVTVAEQHFTQLSRPSTSRYIDAISPSLISTPTQPMSDVDNFLRDLMPTRPAPETPQEHIPPKPILPKSALPLPGRQKKPWTWTGPLYLNSTEQSMCNVKIQQQQLEQDKGLGFSVIFQNIEKIQVSCFYDNADFRANLDVFRAPRPIAFLAPNEDKDTHRFGVLARYVEKAKKVFLMHIFLDDNCIGHVLFFPYAHRLSVIGVDLPAYNQPASLMAAVIPYILSPAQLKQGTKISRNSISVRGKLNLKDLPKLPREPDLEYQHALRILGFSDQLFSYIKNSSSGRSFCIWWERPRRKSPDVETHLLARILEKTRAPHVAYNAEARLVFVHVSALGTLHKLPRFAERRAEKNYVQFYMYGTDSDLSPHVSPVQEIYPCGGIVTFTPLVMRSNPLGVLQLIRRIDNHPLWASYILPSALGLLAMLECGQIDPMSVLDKKPLMMDIILEAIAAGQVSLLEAPPEKPTVTRVATKDNVTGEETTIYLDNILEWIKKYLLLTPPRKFGALSTGIRAMLENTKLSKSEGSLFRTVMDQITIADMALMQRNPMFLSRYRRYVVVDSDMHPSRQSSYVQGLEWTPLSKFDFKDEYYPKQMS
ncbi:hypothetical protein CVT25_003109 [Psilocybe cyanescens]|uniref:Chromo domain-containing protein n=1 Tax=Psilocybe cyanescens TaxID=93625 RepID=A0A409X4Q7_PSICY|nr:hypothetical protein CVT25_003109 [Psilocybe cyanescens]